MVRIGKQFKITALQNYKIVRYLKTGQILNPDKIPVQLILTNIDPV